MNYHNEYDPFAAQWLENVIAEGLIAPGVVDRRDIRDVRPSELIGYTQCHFFAGIGGWPFAFRLAGFPDDRPAWTGSCPCQPYSAAGQGKGFDDERHLWPSFDFLIEQCRPPVIFGEQVAAAIRFGWGDLVQRDLEAKGYAWWSDVLGSHSVGAPHIRQRMYFVADTSELSYADGWLASYGDLQCGGEHRLLAENGRSSTDGLRTEIESPLAPRSNSEWELKGSSNAGVGTDATNANRGRGEREAKTGTRENGERRRGSSSDSSAGVWTDANGGRSSGRLPESSQRQERLANQLHYASEGFDKSRCDGVATGLQRHSRNERNCGKPGWLGEEETRSVAETGATRGFWNDSDWWYGRDGLFRPIEPGLFPLAHGVSNRVGRLRGYGNAITPQVAAEVVKAYLDCRPEVTR